MNGKLIYKERTHTWYPISMAFMCDRWLVYIIQ